MTEVVWENLAKAVDDKTKVSEEIDADMLEHNQDASAHGQTGEALDVHKKSDPIDHPFSSRFYLFSSPSQILNLTGETSDIGWTTLDISAYIPTTARAVILHVHVEVFTANEARFMINKDGWQNAYVFQVSSCVENNKGGYGQGFVSMDTSRKLNYALDLVAGATVDVEIRLVGYVK